MPLKREENIKYTLQQTTRYDFLVDTREDDLNHLERDLH